MVKALIVTSILDALLGWLLWWLWSGIAETLYNQPHIKYVYWFFIAFILRYHLKEGETKIEPPSNW